MTIYIGIDNGLNGGISVLNNNQIIMKAEIMPIVKGAKKEYNIKALKTLFRIIKGTNHKLYCALEKAHVRPVSGKRACFMTGYGYGVIQALLTAYDIPYEIVDPRIWQKEIFKGLNYEDTKQASIMFCKRKWPEQKFTVGNSKKDHDGICDSLCLALYCYRMNR